MRRLLAVGIFAAFVAAPAAPADAAGMPINRDLASVPNFEPQYQDAARAVSQRKFAAVSPLIGDEIGHSFTWKDTWDLQLDPSIEVVLNRATEMKAAQYQPDSDRANRRLMLRIGLGLGIAYGVFLAAWIWATRLRSRPPPH